jgi:membrane protein implicated in regulation of membrane protease activity
MLTLAYVVLAVVGAAFVAYSALTGHFTDGGGAHADASGHAGPDTHYGVEGTGHGSTKASDAAGTAFHFPFFSPLALATLFAALGAWGLIAQFGLHLADAGSLLLAVPAAVATAYAVTYAGWRLVAGSRGSSEIRMTELAGARAEVITPIPAGGTGEVVALVGGQRFTAPAREAEGKELSRGSLVTVLRVGPTLVVSAGGAKEGARDV